MTFGRTRSRDRSRGHSSARPPLVLDFRAAVPTFGWAVDTLAPAGCAYTRAASPGTVQSGTSTLYDLSIFSAVANLLVWGRAVDSWDVGLLLGGARTNYVPYSSDYTTGGGLRWALGGTVTQTTGQTGPTGTAVATRLQATGASDNISKTATGLGALAAVSATSWVKPNAPPNDVAIVATSGAGNAIASSVWNRLVASGGTGTADAGGACALYVVFGSASGGLSAAARDWLVYGSQIELGGFPDELIPTAGAPATRAATFLRALSATVTPKLATGRLSIELRFRAKGARTEYGGTTSLWYVDASNQASFVPSTGVLTITVAGATNTCTLPAWARLDLIELSVQCGGGLATVVKYRLNAGAVTSLAITGSALGTHATGDLYLLSTNAGQHLSAWLYTAAFYAPGAPSWAA